MRFITVARFVSRRPERGMPTVRKLDAMTKKLGRDVPTALPEPLAGVVAALQTDIRARAERAGAADGRPDFREAFRFFNPGGKAEGPSRRAFAAALLSLGLGEELDRAELEMLTLLVDGDADGRIGHVSYIQDTAAV